MRAILPTALAEQYADGISLKELLAYDLIGYEKTSYIFNELLRKLHQYGESNMVLFTNNPILIKNFVGENTAVIDFLTEVAVRCSLDLNDNAPIMPVRIMDLEDTLLLVLAISRKGSIVMRQKYS